jgi:hypothetical protein
MHTAFYGSVDAKLFGFLKNSSAKFRLPERFSATDGQTASGVKVKNFILADLLNRFGDCKGKTIFFYGILRASGGAAEAEFAFSLIKSDFMTIVSKGKSLLGAGSNTASAECAETLQITTLRLKDTGFRS